jgi:hypothetical protein
MGLQPIIRLLTLAWYRWALRQIDPLHPDVPEIVVKIVDLENAHAA